MNGTANPAIVTGHVGRVGTLIAIAVGLLPVAAAAQTAKEVKGVTPLVDSGAANTWSRLHSVPDGTLAIVPAFGNGAPAVSPRVGHLHHFVDDQSWPIVDTSGETLSSSDCQRVPARAGGRDAQADSGASQVVAFAVAQK